MQLNTFVSQAYVVVKKINSYNIIYYLLMIIDYIILIKSNASLAAFPYTYFYAHFRISLKKKLEGNDKMHIN